MPVFTFTSPEGKEYEISGPDGATKEQAFEILQTQLSSAPKTTAKPMNDDLDKSSSPEKGMSFANQVAAGTGAALVNTGRGLKQLIDIPAQALEGGLKGSAIGRGVNKLGSLLGMQTAEQSAEGTQADIDEAKRRDAPLMSTAGGIVGNVAGNVALMALPGSAAAKGVSAVPKLNAILNTAKGGKYVAPALGGAAQGFIQPVASDDSRTAQTAIGAVGGAVITPAVSKAVGGLANMVNSAVQKLRPVSPASAAQQADEIVSGWLQSSPELKSAGFDLSSIPQGMLDGVKGKVAQALASGKQIDPAALLRQADFEAVGVAPTAGQLTRSPMQFAQERNLRGVDLGDGTNPLASRFAEQGNRLRQIFSAADSAEDPYIAGNKLVKSLQGIDSPKKAAVSDAYNTARTAVGAQADLPTTSLSQAYGNVLETFGTENIPSAVARRIESYGLGSVKQTKVFNVDEADKLIKVINANYNPANKTQAAALNDLRTAVQGSIDELADKGASIGQDAAQAFGTARKAASERFKTIESSPAYKAALDGADPDNFVKKYVIGATTNDLKSLANIAAADPAAKGVMRAQITDHLRTKAFGTDRTGDAPFSPETFNKALDAMGKEKLAALFTKEEVDQLYRVGRVMSYIKTQPEGSAVNNSNTGSAVMNLLSNLTGKVGQLPLANLARDSFRTYKNEKAINNALNPIINPTKVKNGPGGKLEQILRNSGVGGAAALAVTANQ